VFWIKLDALLVVARQVYDVNPKLEVGFFKGLSVARDCVLLKA
jgi:hypothetical protein